MSCDPHPPGVLWPHRHDDATAGPETRPLSESYNTAGTPHLTNTIRISKLVVVKVRQSFLEPWVDI